MDNDSVLVEDINKALEELNRAVREAERAGLEVDIYFTDFAFEERKKSKDLLELIKVCRRQDLCVKERKEET